MKRKPTQAYLELQRIQKENAIREQQEQQAKQLHDTMSKEADRKYMDGVFAKQDAARNKEKVQNEWAQFRTQVKSDIVESVLSSIVQKALPDVINEQNFVDSIVREFVEEEGVYKLLDRMSTKTALLSELAISINEAYDEEIEEVDPKDPDSYVANTTASTSLVDKIKGDEGMADITDLIRDKVSRATEEFVEKNVLDQQDIKDTLADVKERIASVKTGDDELDEEIRESWEMKGKAAVKKITNRAPSGVFEQLVKNMASSVMKNEALREQYTISGRINMESLVDKAKCIYTLIETVNTLRIKEFTPEDITKMIQFS